MLKIPAFTDRYRSLDIVWPGLLCINNTLLAPKKGCDPNAQYLSATAASFLASLLFNIGVRRVAVHFVLLIGGLPKFLDILS